MPSPEAVAYLFYGQDEPGLRDHLAVFLAELGADDFNLTRLNGRDTSPADLEAAAGSLPFLAEYRVVLVENISELNAAQNFPERLSALLPGLADWARLIFYEVGLGEGGGENETARKRKQARRQALKQVTAVLENDPRGSVRSFDPPGTAAEWAAWLTRRAARQGLTLEPAAAQELLTRVGDDMLLAETELAKLGAYAAGQGRAINREDVQLLTPYTPEASVFDMVDAMGKRDAKTALELLARLIEANTDTYYPLSLFAMIVRQYRLLIQMREYLDAGGSAGGAASALGMKPYPARKIAEQAAFYKLDRLERLYKHLLEVDLKMKTGQIEPRLALETLIARLGRA